MFVGYVFLLCIRLKQEDDFREKLHSDRGVLGFVFWCWPVIAVCALFEGVEWVFNRINFDGFVKWLIGVVFFVGKPAKEKKEQKVMEHTHD